MLPLPTCRFKSSAFTSSIRRNHEKRILGPGDSVFMPAGVVHATFNVGKEDATVLAILGPCVGEMGAENIDVSGQAPWNELRAKAA
jgi:mannose-6-phosphate isomerase-like protein (cupin superfamily)